MIGEEEKYVDNDFALQIMQRLDFFCEFTQLEKIRLSKFYKHITIYKAGRCIIKEAESSTSFYIILSGKVIVTKGESVMPIATMGPGEFFGEISFLTNTYRTANIIAEEDTITIKVNKDVLEQMGPVLREKIKDQIISKLILRLNSMNNSFRTLS